MLQLRGRQLSGEPGGRGRGAGGDGMAGIQESNLGMVSEAASPSPSSCAPRDGGRPNGLFVCLHGYVGLRRGKST